jgi:hypothetical protein
MTDTLKDARPTNVGDGLRDAARYWERRRLVYNAFLLVVFAAWVAFTWPHFRPAFAPFPLFQLCVLALLANACYSAVYLAEFAFQSARANPAWRPALWIAGTVFAILLENYWIADEIYPYVS